MNYRAFNYVIFNEKQLPLRVVEHNWRLLRFELFCCKKLLFWSMNTTQHLSGDSTQQSQASVLHTYYMQIIIHWNHTIRKGGLAHMILLLSGGPHHQNVNFTVSHAGCVFKDFVSLSKAFKITTLFCQTVHFLALACFVTYMQVNERYL